MADTSDHREHPVSVLLVDDDPDIRKMYGRRLAADGFDVIFAADGSEALAAARCTLGLILLDVRMPGIGGLEVLRQLKDDSSVAAVPVVMLSNESDVATVTACRAMGAVAWWTKSGLLPAELSRRIRDLTGTGL